MVHLKRITETNAPELEHLTRLYISSFPEEERRSIPQLYLMIRTIPEMSFNAILHEGMLAGLAVYWDLGNFFYMEHLAVFPEMRNHKIGQQVLAYWKENLPKLQLLEVEPANDEMACRRIKFYERNGYQVLWKDYVQPSYVKDEDACPLWIMGSSTADGMESKIELIKQKAYREPLRLIP